MTMELANEDIQNTHPEDKALEIESETSDFEKSSDDRQAKTHETSTIGRDGGPQTGPKGVLADYKYTKKAEYQKYQENIKEQKLYMQSISKVNPLEPVKTIWQKEETQVVKVKKSDSSQQSDSDLDSSFELDELESDEEKILELYKQERIENIKRELETQKKGELTKMSAIEYVEAVDRCASQDTLVVVLLHFENYPISERFKAQLEKLVYKYPNDKFIIVDSAECGFEDPEIMPILLIYQRGELVANHVKATNMLDNQTKFDEKMIDFAFLLPLQKSF
ncbi:hypothetical protein BB561_004184 [Smittium simulii]|uniref:Phosducin domain-containing protein n=1 Tax=Smittium simulii TaxID=133385 RepID=A0A2T9YHN2_9FUNG|nr:hypothetical protein BB561_004184 [Smittium simulii]